MRTLTLFNSPKFLAGFTFMLIVFGISFMASYSVGSSRGVDPLFSINLVKKEVVSEWESMKRPKESHKATFSVIPTSPLKNDYAIVSSSGEIYSDYSIFKKSGDVLVGIYGDYLGYEMDFNPDTERVLVISSTPSSFTIKEDSVSSLKRSVFSLSSTRFAREVSEIILSYESLEERK